MIVDAGIPERRELAERMSREKPDEFCRRLPDYLEMVEPPMEGRDCWIYALGPEVDNVKDIYGLCHLVEDEERKPDDIMVYISKGEGPTHAAIYEGNHTVKSVWGEGGPAFRHKIDHVPLGWGNIALFFRKNTA